MKIGKMILAMAAVTASFGAQATTIKYSVIETASGKETVVMSGTASIGDAPTSISKGVSTPYVKSFEQKIKKLPKIEAPSKEEGMRPLLNPAPDGKWPDVISDCFPCAPEVRAKPAQEMGEAFDGISLIIKKTKNPSIFEIDFKKYGVSWVYFSMQEPSGESLRLPQTSIESVAHRKKLDIGVKAVVFDSAAPVKGQLRSIKEKSSEDVRVEITRLD